MKIKNFTAILIFTFLTVSNCFSQTLLFKKYIDSNNIEIDSAMSTFTEFYFEINTNEFGSNFLKIKKNSFEDIISEIYFMDLDFKIKQGKYKKFTNNILTYESIYLNDTLNGLFNEYFLSGRIKEKGMYKKSNLDDSLHTYYETGVVRRRDFYNNNELKSGKCYSSLGADTTYFKYETDAEFQGGIANFYSFIAKNLIYPQVAIEEGIQGECFVNFGVSKAGEIYNIRLLKGVTGCPECDKESLRVVRLMPKWKPATIDGRVVNSYYRIPINFNLE